ncbi:zinc finger protein 629 isoform X2 [Drosophila busckii]|nr:zinc finger protein 629 isoform X2 [Drosophila busckii]
MICGTQAPMEHDSTRCSECEGKELLIKSSESDEDMEQEQQVPAEQAEQQQQQLPTQHFPATLHVTLVPCLPKRTPAAAPPPPPPAPIVTIAAARSPAPQSCSSSNSCSSLSNDVAPKQRLSKSSRSLRCYPCPLCQRPFGTRHNLKRHYMIHTGEKPYSCSKCRKPFREYSTLKKHMVTHKRERWYKCLKCPAQYQDYLQYVEHKSTHGLDAAATAGKLRQRQRSCDSEDGDSSVEDWLECYECQMRFTQLDAYTAHLKQHDLQLYGISVDDLDDEDQDVDVA